MLVVATSDSSVVSRASIELQLIALSRPCPCRRVYEVHFEQTSAGSSWLRQLQRPLRPLKR